MKIHEHVFGVYDANVAAEQITATKYVQSLTPESLSAACMKDIDPNFHERLVRGKIMVAGPNFGCNSSREWAPRALRYAGVQVVIADSFARIFYRNAINIGLPIFECPGIRDFCKEGEELMVDLSRGEVENVTQGTKTTGTVLPEFLLAIMSAGGLLETLEAEGNGGEAGA
jgi:3-isopropylmalate/(R)-2-methylmalate dehydratase small subunit